MPVAFQVLEIYLVAFGVPVAVAGAIATVAAYATYSYLLNRAASLLLDKRAGRTINSGLEVTITDTATEGFAIYGCVRVAGINKIPPITGGTDGRYLEQVMELALHDCFAVPVFYADDIPYNNNSITAITGASTDGGISSGQYANVMWVRRYLTTAGRSVDYILNNRYPTVFTSDFKGQGRSFVAATYDYADGKKYTSGVPGMTFIVAGRLCYDPRLDSTQSGGSGSHRLATPSTWEYTENPALHWADYAYAEIGGSVPEAGINYASVMAAANICDGFVDVPFGIGTFVDTANSTHSGNTFTKTGADNTWGAGSYSSDSESTDLSLRFRVKTGGVGGALVCGLHTSATVAAGGSSLSTAYGIYLHADSGVITITEGGTEVFTIVARAPKLSDVFQIDYDGKWINYYINNILVYQTAGTGAPLFFNFGSYHINDGVTISTSKRYTSNGRIGLARDWRDNAKLFIDAMVGRMVRRDGVWYIYAGAYDAPTFTVNKGDWIALESIKTVAPRDGGRWNTSRVWYTDKNRNWQREECYPRRNATYKADDAGEEITLESEQPLCCDEFEAQRKGEFLLRQSRNQITVVGLLPPRFHFIATGEMGTFNFEDFGWVSKIMRVRAMNLQQDGSVRIVAVEEQAADWTDLTQAEYNAPSTSTIPAVNPTSPSAPSSLAVDQNLNGTLMFNIGDPIVKPKETYYQIIRSTVSSNAAVGTVVWQGDIQRATILAPSSVHYYYARAISNSYVSPYFPNTNGISAVPLGWLTSQINSNAATEVYTGYDSSVNSNNVLVGNMIGVNFTNPGCPCAALITGTGTFHRNFLGGVCQVYVQGGALASENVNISNTSDLTTTVQLTTSILSSTNANSVLFAFNCGTQTVLGYRDVRLKIELIKL